MGSILLGHTVCLKVYMYLIISDGICIWLLLTDLRNGLLQVAQDMYERRKGLSLKAFPEACMCTRLSLVLLSKLRAILWESILSLFCYRFLVKPDITSSSRQKLSILILTWISKEYCNFSHTSSSNTANAQGLAPDFHAGQGLNSAFKLDCEHY